MVLNLTPPFNPFQASPDDCLRYKTFTFPGGEPHITIKDCELTGCHIHVSTRLDSFQSFGYLMMAVDALKRMNIASFDLCIPYFPGARQDRVMVPGEPLTSKVLADLINQLGAKCVHIFDPHSSVTPALLSHVNDIPNHDFIGQCLGMLPPDIYLIAPDAGASKKIHDLAAALEIPGDRLIFCSKKRDVATGKLSGFEVYADDLYGKPCLLVDDICDGGGTFMGLAEKLQQKHAGPLFLAITHGIFSKGIDDLAKHFERIITTDSFPQKHHHPQLTVMPLTIEKQASFSLQH